MFGASSAQFQIFKLTMKKLALFKGKAMAFLILMCLLVAQSSSKNIVHLPTPNKTPLNNVASPKSNVPDSKGTTSDF